MADPRGERGRENRVPGDHVLDLLDQRGFADSRSPLDRLPGRGAEFAADPTDSGISSMRSSAVAAPPGRAESGPARARGLELLSSEYHLRVAAAGFAVVSYVRVRTLLPGPSTGYQDYLT